MRRFLNSLRMRFCSLKAGSPWTPHVSLTSSDVDSCDSGLSANDGVLFGMFDFDWNGPRR